MGGWSHEREVSLVTGAACAGAIRRSGHEVTCIDVGHDITDRLSLARPDIAFNALHGPFGEDGAIQGVLEIMQIPYTHSGVAAAALAMDKHKAKQIAAAAGVPVAPGKVMRRADIGPAHPLPPPYVVKPLREGSSFGIITVHEGENAPPAQIAGDAARFGPDVLVERYIPGRELTCAVMDGQASEVCEITPLPGSIYDYDAKYKKGGSRHTIPAEISPFVYQEVRKWSLTAHRVIGCHTISRSDFRYDADGSGALVFLEINTQPGMTPTSLVPDLAAAGGEAFDTLVMRICMAASLKTGQMDMKG